jgi:hypothetical protein
MGIVPFSVFSIQSCQRPLKNGELSVREESRTHFLSSRTQVREGPWPALSAPPRVEGCLPC